MSSFTRSICLLVMLLVFITSASLVIEFSTNADGSLNLSWENPCVQGMITTSIALVVYELMHKVFE